VHPSTHKKAKADVKSSIGKRGSSNKHSASEAFDKLLKTKWFKGGKTLIDLREKLKEMAIIVPTSQLPQYLLKACRGEHPTLERKQETMSGKKLWVYSPTNNNE
jgi:hypothetical protein